MKKLVIYGAWYLSHVIAEAAEASAWEVLGFVDPEPPEDMATLKSLPEDAAVFVAIGNNHIRETVTSSLLKHGRRMATIVHPTACISPSASIEPGSFIGELVIVRTKATLHQGVALQAGSIVSHDCQVESFATFGPNAVAAGRVRIGQRTLIGAGASIAPGVSIGEDCIVTVGAGVFRDSENNKKLIGNPAQVKPNPSRRSKQSNWHLNVIW